MGLPLVRATDPALLLGRGASSEKRSNYSDLTRPGPPNGGLVMEIPFFQGNRWVGERLVHLARNHWTLQKTAGVFVVGLRFFLKLQGYYLGSPKKPPHMILRDVFFLKLLATKNKARTSKGEGNQKTAGENISYHVYLIYNSLP